MLSSRSSSIATQPMPPSLIAIFRSGESYGVARPQPLGAAPSDSWPNSVAPSCTSGRVVGHVGHPRAADVQADHGVGLGARRDDRVPVVAKIDGRPDGVRTLGERDRREAALALRRIILGAASRVGEVRDAERDDPLGVALVPLLEEPVVPRPHAREAQLAVLGVEKNTRPQNPVIIDGKFSDAHTPLRSMSRDAGVDVVATRAHLLEAERLDRTVSGRRPATAFMPTWVAGPSNSHTWWPLGRLDDLRGPVGEGAGSRPSNRWRGSTTWSSTEMTVYFTSRGFQRRRWLSSPVR